MGHAADALAAQRVKRYATRVDHNHLGFPADLYRAGAERRARRNGNARHGRERHESYAHGDRFGFWYATTAEAPTRGTARAGHDPPLSNLN